MWTIRYRPFHPLVSTFTVSQLTYSIKLVASHVSALLRSGVLNFFCAVDSSLTCRHLLIQVCYDCCNVLYFSFVLFIICLIEFMDKHPYQLSVQLV